MTALSEAERVAKGLTEAQRATMLSFRSEPRQMGVGMTHWLPGLVEPDGLNHPCFGPHHRLTPLGLEVRKLLEAQS